MTEDASNLAKRFVDRLFASTPEKTPEEKKAMFQGVYERLQGELPSTLQQGMAWWVCASKEELQAAQTAEMTTDQRWAIGAAREMIDAVLAGEKFDMDARARELHHTEF